MTNQDIQREDTYLPYFYYHDLTYHISDFIFRLPKGNHLKHLLTAKSDLLNDTIPKTINSFPKNIFKILQETFVKTAIDNYINKLTVSFVNKSYFLYNKSNMINQTFRTEINKLIFLYVSISYFDKKSINKALQIVSFNSPLKIYAVKNTIKNTLDFQLTKIGGNHTILDDKKYTISLLQR